MEIKITNGNYDVINSGTIVGNYDTNVEFNFDVLTFVFEFINDKVISKSRIEKEAFNNEKSLKLKFINFNNTLGLGNTSPEPLGTINNRKLFLNYRIYLLNNSTGKTIHYTFLLEKEA